MRVITTGALRPRQATHMALLRAHVPGASSAAVGAVFASVVKYGAVDLYLICWGKYARMADLYLYLICIWPCIWYLGVSIELAAARQLQPALRRHRVELAAAGYCRLLL